MYNVIIGFLMTIGAEAQLPVGMAWPTGTIEARDGFVTIIGLFGVQTRICKDAFSDSLLVGGGLFGIKKIAFDREGIKRRATAARYRANDACGKKRETEMRDKLAGARIALQLIGEEVSI